MTDDERRRELIRLVESEIDGLRSLMAGVLTAGNTVRVAGIAVWSAAIAASIVNHLPLLAGLAVIALLAAALVDAYHGHLYAATLSELTRDERIVNRYYELLGRYAGDARRLEKLDQILENRRYGIHSKLQRPTLIPVRDERSGGAGRAARAEDAARGIGRVDTARAAATGVGRFLLGSRPAIVFRVLYPTLAVLGAVATVVLAVS